MLATVMIMIIQIKKIKRATEIMEHLTEVAAVVRGVVIVATALAVEAEHLMAVAAVVTVAIVTALATVVVMVVLVAVAAVAVAAAVAVVEAVATDQAANRHQNLYRRVSAFGPAIS